MKKRCNILYILNSIKYIINNIYYLLSRLILKKKILGDINTYTLFIVKRNKIYTPILSYNNIFFSRIPRYNIIYIAENLGYDVIEKELYYNILKDIDEIFIVNVSNIISLEYNFYRKEWYYKKRLGQIAYKFRFIMLGIQNNTFPIK